MLPSAPKAACAARRPRQNGAMAEILIRAGERRRIVHLVSDSIPQQVRFEASAVAGGRDGGEVSGQVEVAGSRWLFRKPPQRLPLRRENLVRKGMWDTLFSIYVTPDQDTRIVLRSRLFTAGMLLWVLVVVLVLGIAGALLWPMLATEGIGPPSQGD
jgi:hypothetical protein